MKIVQLTAENVKRIKAVEITPDGSLVEIAGRNAQGKSSVLDAIWMALEWKAAGKATTQPVRDGEDHARVRLDLGDLVVTRTWGNGKTSLLVESADGTPQQRPQELLDALVGRLSFDPLAFTQQDDKTQVRTLMGLVDLPFDPEELAKQRQDLYEKRHLVGQEVTRAKGAWESMPAMASNGLPYEDLPSEPVKTQDLLTEYQAAVDTINSNGRIRDRYTSATSKVDRLKDELAEAVAELKTATLASEAMPEDTDLDPIKAKLAEAEATNAAIREGQDYYRLKADWSAKGTEWKALDAQITALDQKKADALAKAKFPIKGLSFGDDGVTFQGIPFGQASSAEQLKVSMAIAMASNPQLRVIRIMDGSLLDKDNLAVIERLAKERDFQVWIERVDSTVTSGVVIEDGKVV